MKKGLQTPGNMKLSVHILSHFLEVPGVCFFCGGLFYKQCLYEQTRKALGDCMDAQAHLNLCYSHIM